jgi:hypothetical protein
MSEQMVWCVSTSGRAAHAVPVADNGVLMMRAVCGSLPHFGMKDSRWLTAEDPQWGAREAGKPRCRQCCRALGIGYE